MKKIARVHHITQDHSDISHEVQARYACEAGVSWIQFRAKNAKGDELFNLARATQTVCQHYQAIFLVNDHVQVALETGADGVHLGKTDMSPDRARMILGADKIIGGTANTFEDIQQLVGLGVDYVGVGPFRFTKTKHNLNPILGLEGYKFILNQCQSMGIHIPIIAIGGIQAEDVAAIRKVGVYGIAVSSAINLASSPTRAATQFLQATT